MFKIKRIYQDLGVHLQPDKVLMLFGPRQVGKTTLMMDYLKSTDLKYKLVTGDNLMAHKPFLSQNLNILREFCEGYGVIAIDEAQKIPNIGAALKLMVDQIPGIRILATGSSSFELAGQTGEPLTGRKITLMLYPVSQSEMLNHFNRYELKEKLHETLIYGSYPAVVAEQEISSKLRILKEISGSYLFRDILAFDRIKSPQLLLDLLRLLAFQIGKEVSVNELAKNLGIDNKTVKKYLELLEKSYVLISLHGFSKNLRKEVTRHSKYYFYDTGIRNAIIANFNPLELRNDTGQLWENFLVTERLKKQAYKPLYANNFFWRTWAQNEIDFVEERDGNVFGYEFKWKKTDVKPPNLWVQTYPEAEFEVINRENYLNFVL